MPVSPSPFHVPPDLIALRDHKDEATSALLQAIAASPDGAITIPEAEGAVRRVGIDQFTFGNLIHRLTRAGAVRLEHIPGRWRVRAATDTTPPPKEGAVTDLLGCMAAAALELAEFPRHTERAKWGKGRIISAARTWSARGFTDAEMLDLIDKAFSDEMAAVIRRELGQSAARAARLSAIPDLTPEAPRVLEAINAAGEVGITRSRLNSAMSRRITPREVERAVQSLLSSGQVIERRGTTPVGGRPGQRLYSREYA